MELDSLGLSNKLEPRAHQHQACCLSNNDYTHTCAIDTGLLHCFSKLIIISMTN